MMLVFRIIGYYASPSSELQCQPRSGKESRRFKVTGAVYNYSTLEPRFITYRVQAIYCKQRRISNLIAYCIAHESKTQICIIRSSVYHFCGVGSSGFALRTKQKVIRHRSPVSYVVKKYTFSSYKSLADVVSDPDVPVLSIQGQNFELTLKIHLKKAQMDQVSSKYIRVKYPPCIAKKKLGSVTVARVCLATKCTRRYRRVRVGKAEQPLKLRRSKLA